MLVRTGKELLIATKPYAVDSTAKSWWHVLSTAVLLIAAFGGTLLNIHWAGKAAFSILSGLLMLRMFVIYHDQQHHAILPSSRLAEKLMWVYGMFTLSPSSIWRSSHNRCSRSSRWAATMLRSVPIFRAG